MKKFIAGIIAITFAILPSIAMDEDHGTSRKGHAKYEPLQIESTVDQKEIKSEKPWYKNRYFWCGAALATTTVVTVAGISYAIYSALKNDETPCPYTISPSPLPSFIQNITETATSALSRTISTTQSALESFTSSMSSTLSKSLSSSPTVSPSDIWFSFRNGIVRFRSINQ